jgi:hypothetical protein
MSLFNFQTSFYLEFLRQFLLVYVLVCLALLLFRAPAIGVWLRAGDEAEREAAAGKILPLARRIALGLLGLALVSLVIVVLTMKAYYTVVNDVPVPFNLK